MKRWSALAAVLACPAIAEQLASQDLPLKRTLPAATVVACPAFTAPIAPVRAQIDEANRMATLGDEAALEGDHKSARDLFQQAAQINQVDASLASRLGREDEAMGDQHAAILMYCRYLFLSPTAGDAGRIRDKLTALLPGPDLSRGTTMVGRFRDGVQAYDRSAWGEAVPAFSDVVRAAPGFAPAFYDRALALAHQHHQPDAIRDFDQYLKLTPDATDSTAVRERQLSLRRELPSATTAFFLGLIPGAGQYYTRQPLLGVLITGAAAGGVVWGVQSQTVTRTATFIDKNGHPYTQTFPATEHKYLAAGIGAAAGVTLLGAIEAAIVAHNRSSSLAQITNTAAAAPETTGSLPLHLKGPHVFAGADQVGLGLGVEFR
jgi:tetratricopeptide (TPR) repeat protein